MIAAIVARSKNNVIGVNNDLPWNLQSDRRYFRDITNGHTIIMGRKTAESIVARLGHGLPNRQNIVLTRNAQFTAEGFEIAHSIEEALKLASDEDIYIIGGEQIYSLGMPYCQRLHVTEVDVEINNGDAFFPEVDLSQWREVSRENYSKDARNQYNFSIVVLERKN